MGHIELARWAEEIVVAPATAEFIARLAHGFADDLLTTLCLATAGTDHACPCDESTDVGESRDTGQRPRVAGPRRSRARPRERRAGLRRSRRRSHAGAGADRRRVIYGARRRRACCTDLKVVVTAGPTRERIDPVRFISNRSSGKMGYAVAEAARAAGAHVVLVSGPGADSDPARRRSRRRGKRRRNADCRAAQRSGRGHLHRRGRGVRLSLRRSGAARRSRRPATR